ncbi:hypothetical protein DESA109040_04240 [Deinococcus saxicola]
MVSRARELTACSAEGPGTGQLKFDCKPPGYVPGRLSVLSVSKLYKIFSPFNLFQDVDFGVDPPGRDTIKVPRQVFERMSDALYYAA